MRAGVNRQDMPPQPSAVYLVPHTRQHRFKVGWSISPIRRLRHLPEADERTLDIKSAQLAWFRDPVRARQVEKSLHRGLAPFGVQVAHTGDGATEWFHVRGIDLARQLLVMLAAPEGALSRSVLRGLDQKPPWLETEPVSTESADGVWSRVEDVWWRLTGYVPLETEPKEAVLRWSGLKRLILPETYLLRTHALDLETYQWRDEGRMRSLVTLMTWDGDDLVQHLTPTAQMRRWVGSEHVACSVENFLLRQSLAKNR